MVNRQQVRDIVTAADIMVDETWNFCDKHGVKMPMSKEDYRRERRLFLLAQEDRYSVRLVDPKRNTQHELCFGIQYKTPGRA